MHEGDEIHENNEIRIGAKENPDHQISCLSLISWLSWLRGQAVAGPGVVLAAIAQAIVQAVGAALPELEDSGDQPIATPERGAGHGL